MRTVSDFISTTTDVLRRTPELLRTLLRDLPEDWTDTADVPEDGWRPREVVEVLGASREVHGRVAVDLIQPVGRSRLGR